MSVHPVYIKNIYFELRKCIYVCGWEMEILVMKHLFYYFYFWHDVSILYILRLPLHTLMP